MKKHTRAVSEPMTGNMTDEEVKARRAQWNKEVEEQRKAAGLEGNMSPNFEVFKEISNLGDKWHREHADGDHDCLVIIAGMTLGKKNDHAHQLIGVHQIGEHSSIMRAFEGFLDQHPEMVPVLLRSIAGTELGKMLLAGIASKGISTSSTREILSDEELRAKESGNIDAIKEKKDSQPSLKTKPAAYDIPKDQIPPTWEIAWEHNKSAMAEMVKISGMKADVSKNFETMAHAQYILSKFTNEKGKPESQDALIYLGEFGVSDAEIRGFSHVEGRPDALVRIITNYLEDNPEMLPLFEYSCDMVKREIGPLAAAMAAKKMHDLLNIE